MVQFIVLCAVVLQQLKSLRSLSWICNGYVELSVIFHVRYMYFNIIEVHTRFVVHGSPSQSHSLLHSSLPVIEADTVIASNVTAFILRVDSLQQLPVSLCFIDHASVHCRRCWTVH